MICKYSYKRQTRAPCCALYSSPRQRTVGTPLALPARKPGLKSASPAGDLLSLVWVCPRPERFPIPYLQIMNNNTQGKILYCSKQNKKKQNHTWNLARLAFRNYYVDRRTIPRAGNLPFSSVPTPGHWAR